MIELNQLIKKTFEQSNAESIRFTGDITLKDDKIMLVKDIMKIEFLRSKNK